MERRLSMDFTSRVVWTVETDAILPTDVVADVKFAENHCISVQIVTALVEADNVPLVIDFALIAE